MAKACGATRLKIFGDSQLVAHQVMNRCDALSENMIAYRDAYNDLEGTFDGCEVNHVSRLSNDEADVLANIGSAFVNISSLLLEGEVSNIKSSVAKGFSNTSSPSLELSISSLEETWIVLIV